MRPHKRIPGENTNVENQICVWCNHDYIKEDNSNHWACVDDYYDPYDYTIWCDWTRYNHAEWYEDWLKDTARLRDEKLTYLLGDPNKNTIGNIINNEIEKYGHIRKKIKYKW